MRRIYNPLIKNHFNEDDLMLFFTGPRQVGKTTTAKSLENMGPAFCYLNWDLDDQLSPNFRHFAQFLPKPRYIQLVKTLKREKTFPEGFAIKSLIPWLKNINLKSF